MSRIKTIARNLHLILTRDVRDLLQAQDARADAYEREVDARLEARFTAIEQSFSTRADSYEAAVDARLEQRFTAIEQRIDDRLATAEARLDFQFAKGAKSLDKRFDARARALDLRLDDRLAHMERRIDQRYTTLEQRTDERLEAHERKVDAKIHQTSQDIVDRTDLMLQIFEQRLDQLRRQLRALPQSLPAAPAASESRDTSQTKADSQPPTLSAVIGSGSGAAAALATEAHAQLQSFRKLAESAASRPFKLAPGETPLYHQILAWKKVAHEGINDFTPDEQETVDYILSFIHDPKELAYVKDHLRRFVATLQRIPPAQRTSDRLLELGSLLHLTPAIKKYCGYGEICCADMWDSAEKVTHEMLRQKDGPDCYTFELRNFNVEKDPFPYPDNYFRTVLCCELIEHLRSDPMHMLWECNRVLLPDGYLLLTTPNIASARAIEGLLVGCTPYLLSQYNRREIADQHNREYAPYEVGLALTAAGFTVVELETEDVWARSNPAILELLKQVRLSTELRGDNIFALARKTSAPIERYPKELYID